MRYFLSFVLGSDNPKPLFTDNPCVNIKCLNAPSARLRAKGKLDKLKQRKISFSRDAVFKFLAPKAGTPTQTLLNSQGWPLIATHRRAANFITESRKGSYVKRVDQNSRDHKARKVVQMMFEDSELKISDFEKIGWNEKRLFQYIDALVIPTSVDSEFILSALYNLMNQLRGQTDDEFLLPTFKFIIQNYTANVGIKIDADLATSITNQIVAALKALGNAYTFLVNCHWSKSEIEDTLSTVAKLCEKKAHLFFEDMLPAIRELKKYPQTYPTNFHQIYLLKTIAEYCHPVAHEALRQLPHVLSFSERDNKNAKSARLYVRLLARSAQYGAPAVFFHIAKLDESLKMRGLAEKQRSDLRKVIVTRSRQHFADAKRLLEKLLPHLSQGNFSEFRYSFDALLLSLNDHNRSEVLNTLISNLDLYCSPDVNEQSFDVLVKHLALFTEIMNKWPCAGLTILQGLFAAIRSGTITDMLAQKDDVMTFVNSTNNFNAHLFEAYLATDARESFLFTIRGFCLAALRDKVSVAAMHKILNKYGADFLLGLLQLTTPVSGLSNLGIEEQRELMLDFLQMPDLRDDVPEAWRNRFNDFVITTGTRKLKEGETADPEHMIQYLKDTILNAPSMPELSKSDLAGLLLDYINAPEGDQKLEKRVVLTNQLLTYMGQYPWIHDYVETLAEKPHALAAYLSDLFCNPDQLPDTLRKIFALLPSGALEHKGTQQPLKGGAGLVKSIVNIWNKPDLPLISKEQIISNILRPYLFEDIESCVLMHPKIQADAELTRFIASNKNGRPDLSREKIVSDILTPWIDYLRQENARYTFTTTGSTPLRLAPVKGPGYILNGLTSGLCTAQDGYLWQNPNFWLVAIIDTTQNVAVGFIYVYQFAMGGKKFIALPGINPSDEFAATMNVDDLLESLLTPIITWAQEAGYSGVFIPTDPNISSNLGELRKSIKRRYKKIRTIKTIHWNQYPKSYPFSEVYSIWEEPRTDSTDVRQLNPQGITRLKNRASRLPEESGV